tara:strand:+ start:165 stop:353 length:189 start_codon:yes stop_codon:yes gene_type:complete
MPYIIIKVKGGFKVAKKSNPKETYSNKPLSKKMAEKQKLAIEISERQSQAKKVKSKTVKKKS